MFASVLCHCVLQYTINQDEHKIPMAELVTRLETSLDNVGMTSLEGFSYLTFLLWITNEQCIGNCYGYW